MIHGYHVVLATYGFWLPNDPRGSWSNMVWNWELIRFGKPSRGQPARASQELSQDQREQRAAWL
ncbi:hypothetical protein Pan181_01120 [Aeoliella mucimassa]|uniref:Uncharacterized protein n=1 Tax=Aeoliella mucimassa TaxID=2527972 RepID=A0A518AGR9_9BACT|nr:hypothetical protein Pan181_01120 [Aeoliella mucimassa]